MSRAEEPVAVIVSVADDHLEKIGEVLAGLRGAGLRVATVLDAIGTITGTVHDGAIEALSLVRGVAAVERERIYRSAPPDAEIQ